MKKISLLIVLFICLISCKSKTENIELNNKVRVVVIDKHQYFESETISGFWVVGGHKFDCLECRKNKLTNIK